MSDTCIRAGGKELVDRYHSDIPGEPQSLNPIVLWVSVRKNTGFNDNGEEGIQHLKYILYFGICILYPGSAVNMMYLQCMAFMDACTWYLAGTYRISRQVGRSRHHAG